MVFCGLNLQHGICQSTDPGLFLFQPLWVGMQWTSAYKFLVDQLYTRIVVIGSNSSSVVDLLGTVKLFYTLSASLHVSHWRCTRVPVSSWTCQLWVFVVSILRNMKWYPVGLGFAHSFFFFFLSSDRINLICSPNWSWIQVCNKPPASVSQVLWLQGYATLLVTVSIVFMTNSPEKHLIDGSHLYLFFEEMSIQYLLLCFLFSIVIIRERQRERENVPCGWAHVEDRGWRVVRVSSLLLCGSQSLSRDWIQVGRLVQQTLFCTQLSLWPLVLTFVIQYQELFMYIGH